MAVVSYTSTRGTYTRVPCGIDDVYRDVETIKSTLVEQGEILENENEYINNMLQSVYEDKAFAIECQGNRIGFIYNRTDERFPRKLVASSLYMPNDPIALIIMMLSLTLSKYRYLVVFPHGKNLITFKSFITRPSMRLYNAGVNNYVLIGNNEHSTHTIRKLVKLFQIKKVK